jgi:hypothetical protein
VRQFVGLALDLDLSHDGDRELISSIVGHQKVEEHVDLGKIGKRRGWDCR